MRAQMKPYIQYLPATAELILKTSGRGSFIAPAVGFLHFGPDCYLYDHVCNFNYQGPPQIRDCPLPACMHHALRPAWLPEIDCQWAERCRAACAAGGM
jgi:hypothetical protein